MSRSPKRPALVGVPAVDVVPAVLYVDAGDVLTSGGVAAGIDLCLHIVRHDFGADIASCLARRLVVGPAAGGQAQFIEHPVPAATAGTAGTGTSVGAEHLHEQRSMRRSSFSLETRQSS